MAQKSGSNGPAHAKAPQGKKPIVPILIGVAIVAVGVIAFLVATKKPQVEVPDILYCRSAEAEAELTKVGLKLGKVTSEKTDDIPYADMVWKQSVEAGTKVEADTAIDVVVSEGQSLDEPVKVPDLTGLTPEEAEDKLFDALFIPQEGKQVYSDTVEPGRVCAQSVAAGTEALPFKLTVTYSVSLGKEKVKVPDLVGKTTDDARKALHDAGLSCDTTDVYNDTVEKGKVVNQSAAKDTEVDKGTTITIEVSLGPTPVTQVLVPNIFTYNLDEAKKALESAGLKYTYEGDENGTVVQVTPAPNTKVDQGSTVKFKLEVPQNTQPAQEQNNTGNQGGQNNQGTGEGGGSSEVNSQSGQSDEDYGMKVNFSHVDAQGIALEVFNRDGQVNNLNTSDVITGGGTKYYKVEFDKDGQHFEVQVDAIDGLIIGASSNDGVIETVYDSDGSVLSTREM